MARVLLAATLALLAALPTNEAPVARADLIECELYFITGYVRTEYSARTYDGTSVYTDEPIVAASWNLPIDTIVEIEELGRFRVADRGHLGARHIDVAVWSRAEAFALTGYRQVCVVARTDAPDDEAGS